MVARKKYGAAIELFRDFVSRSDSSATLLTLIRSEKVAADSRMALLKMFRRCVSPVLDTEMSKKIKLVATDDLVRNYGATFKPIDVLKRQLANLSDDEASALAALIGEYDTRGQLGYALTGMFFDWFEKTFHGTMTIAGPRGAGPDMELRKILVDWKGNYPCDFVVSDPKARSPSLLAVGFARYDSTRGGAQSDDRTGGNADKVTKAREYTDRTGRRFRVLFLADGPGVVHKDTWEEARKLDGEWDDNVRVTTLKLASTRVTAHWLHGARTPPAR